MISITKEKNLNGKVILLRLDLNVPLKNEKISDTTRIDKILPTLNFLIQKKNKNRNFISYWKTKRKNY